MKQRIFLLLMVAVAAACSKNDDLTSAGQPGDLTFSFEAGTSEVTPDPEEMTRAGYDGVKSIWEAGDAVGFTLDGSNNNLQFTQVGGSLSSDGTSVRYTGTLNSQPSGNVSSTAYFPYSSTATVSGQTITTTFPATQTYSAAGGYRGIPLFSSYTGDYAQTKLQFKNLFSVIKLNLVKGVALTNTIHIQKIIFQGNNNETVSGPMSVNLSSVTPVVNYTGSGKTITLDLGAGVELTSAGQTFYIAVPAINYSNGYSFTIVTDAGQVTKSAKNSGATYATNTVYATPPLTISSLSLVSIPDPNLRAALQSLGLISIFDNLLGTVSITSAGLTATSINISGKGITDLTGLDKFPALVSLTAGNNNLVSVDLSKLTLLTNLDLSGNQLSSLNLAANTALLSLNLSANQLTSINLAANTLLTSLNLSSNQLSSLDLAANVALLSLDVSSNLLTSLDLHNNILLTSLKVYGNPLVTLNISGLKALLSLYLVNGIESVNALTKTLTIPTTAIVQNIISDGVALTNWLNFVCNNNPNVVSISVKNNTGLLSVTATGNTNLASLDVSGNLTLTNVTANSNALTTLNLTGDLGLLSLNVASNKLAAISLSGQTAMTTLDVSSNLLTSLDLHNNILLTSAKCYGNTLTTLNISGLKVLTGLYLDATNTATNCFSLLKFTLPAAAKVENLVADNMIVAALWTTFVCTGNTTIKTISLKLNVGILGATVTNNTALTTLDVTGSSLSTLLIVKSGNASGFQVVGALL